MPRATIRRPKPHRRAPDVIDTHPALPAAHKQIAQLRAARGLSQADLAIRTNVSQATISYIEMGSRRLSLNLLLHICDALRADFHFRSGAITLVPIPAEHRKTP